METIKQSVYASLAVELEMNKAIDLLRQGELELAVEALTAFNNKESKVASAASNNLSVISILVGRQFGILKELYVPSEFFSTFKAFNSCFQNF